jgi:small subunit ribosomal protein S9
VNHVDFQHYFPKKSQQLAVSQPLELTESLEKFDVYVNVKGGGVSGQAGAIRLGLSRALVDFDPDLRLALKKAGCMTRDPRMKERKKYGQPGARKRFQFSKR